ncbi:receptor-like protein EIX2 [Senna tora]|uniref:Receptor-like protein EIX2 n=1 Tax=Senna tora TaxID=362788 RepID=A0A834WF48_9FABA|nr:receptor-like protein EIX2 [Senna tora]
MSGSTNITLLLWLFTFSIVDLCICRASSEAACIPSERHALLQLKHHLLDPSNRLASWSSHGDCCKWTSVVCSNATGNVLELHLTTLVPHYDSYEYYAVYEGSRFGGEVHSSILDLKHLNYLDLSGNDFGQIQIPSFLGSMTSLTYLNLSEAGFGGSIPYQIGNLSNLLYLDLGGNYFDGSIPFQIGNLSNLLHLGLEGAGSDRFFAENVEWVLPLSSLQYLELNYVNLSTAFDWLHVLHSLPSLTELHLSGCHFHHHFQPSTINFSSLAILDISYSYNFGASSMIPKWMFELKKLVYLRLRANQLQGSIPDGIQNLTLLQYLDLSDNSFNSSIPNWLYSFTSLNFLHLGFNKLHGTISNSIGNLTSLVTLDLLGNELEGTIPKSVANLCNLRNVFFSNKNSNQQVSEILEIFSTCVLHKLETLYIIDSLLLGNLTDQIGLFKNLVSLDLFHNAIQGTIPASLRNLASLKHLGLSKNQFTGNPFEILGSLSKLQYLLIGGNLFYGVVKEVHLANFTRLIDFSASRNQLTLNVGPNWRPSFQFLNELEMASWNLGPTFPSWLQSLKHLQYLDISNNMISESIPTWFWGTFNTAYFFNLSRNHINGYVDLSWNKMRGELSYLSPYVSYLDLSSNQFSGSITHFLCTEQDELKSLEFLNLASNNLLGEIPDCWMMWPFLSMLKLENNYFTGNLPPTMGSLASLQMLHLRDNRFSGNFPTNLRNCSKLISLDLSENQLSGVIPSWIGQSLFNLKILRLASNKFSGAIPRQICDMSLLHILDLAQNNLTGNIPKCVNHFNAMSVINTSSESYIRCVGVNHSIYTVDVLLLLKGRVDQYSSILGLVTNIDLSVDFIPIAQASKSNSGGRSLDWPKLGAQTVEMRCGEDAVMVVATSCLILITKFSPTASSEAACIPSERHALLQLKHHLLDPSNRLASWSSHGDCCKWTSVVCSNVTGNVLQLHLATFVPNYDDDLYGIYVVYMGSRFGGELHSSILDLKHLDYLDLSGNYFGEIQIPSFLGSMTSLTYLNLSRAGFGGSIPFQIGNLSNLLYLDLGSNNFDGSIPFQIGNLSNLLYLGLQGSYLEPSFAENLQWLSPLSSLQYLKLNYVNLSIAFDWLHVLHSLPSLTELHLSDCVLPHYYQPSTINFSSLENLDISDSNNFAASMIPKWMFELKKLIYLVLKGNQLQGSIPDGIQNLTLLQHLDLSYNSFNSSIPNWLYSFTSLNFLDLGSNMLHGTISNAIGNLTSLITLDLSDQIGLFKNLVSLDLSYNSVQGPIPVSLINLTSLKYLALSKNQFIGNPFEVLGSLSELQKLSIDDNHFHGVVKEAHLSDFPRLLYFFASKNQLTLNVGSNWRPSFQFLMELEMASWHLGPTFPSWLQSLKNLWSLDISKSRISGSIPNWFWGTFMNSIFGGFYVDLSWNNLSGELPYLSLDVFHLDLSNNHFSGSITHLLCTEQDKPKILEFLNLASNNLSGEIPDCWMMWPYLVTLKLEHNNFTGNLPTSMGSLAFLDMLHLRNNRFSGKFPAILRSNRKLISLDLGENQFSGVIPSWVGQSLFNLKILRLASNKFSGSIPHQICDMSLLHILDLSQNNLTGNIPKCVNHLNAMLVINTSSNSYILSRGNQSSSIVDVLLLLKGRVDVYSSILGLVTRFWGVIGPLLYNRSWRHAYFGFIDDLWFKIRLLSDEAFQK